jgi:hypothetical protein
MVAIRHAPDLFRCLPREFYALAGGHLRSCKAAGYQVSALKVRPEILPPIMKLTGDFPICKINISHCLQWQTPSGPEPRTHAAAGYIEKRGR